MRTISISIMAIMVVSLLIGTVGVMTLQQVIAAPNGPEDIVVFRQITGQFQNEVTTALRIGDSSEIPILLNFYTTEVLDIFLGGPDTIPELVTDYKADVGRLLGPC